MEEEVHYRISKVMAILLVLFAASIDIFEMVLEWLGIGIFGLSTLISVCATAAFWIWFKILQVPFVASPKKFFTLALTCLFEVIPGLDALGGFFWTAGTIILIILVRAEDKGGVLGQLSSATTGLVQARYGANKAKIDQISKLNRQELRQQARLLRPQMNISKNELARETAKQNKNTNINKNNVLDLKESNKQDKTS